MKKYIIFFLISVSLYTIHFYATKHGIYGDGNGYFSLAHTVFFQNRLDFQPVYRYLDAFPGAAYTFSRIFWTITPTSTGVLNCPWLIGTSFFWLPAFFAVKLLAFIPGANIGMFSPLYEFGCGVTGILLVLTGLYLIEKRLCYEIGSKLVSAIVSALFLGSQLFYYASFEPALAHQASFFLISLVLFVTGKKASGSTLSVFILGLSVGLLAITRIGEVVLIAIPVFVYLVGIYRKHRQPLLHAMLFTVSCFVGMLPQLLLQKAMYGSIFYNPYLHAEKGIFHALQLSSFWNQMFAPGGGFLLWSPIFIAAVFGLAIGMRERKHATAIYALSLLIYYIFISSWEFVPPSGFGNRFFISTIPFLGSGLAFLFKKHKRIIGYVTLIAIIWNLLLLSQFFLDSGRMVKRKGLTIVNLLTGQITVPLQKTRFTFLIQ